MRPTTSLAIGALGGLLSGALGVGGGIVIVPLLVLTLGLSQHSAHATSLAAIVPIAAVGAGTFAAHGEISYGIAGLLTLGTLVGAPLGARAMVRTSEAGLKIAFGTLAVVVGASLLLR